jgi:hypothetical protein
MGKRIIKKREAQREKERISWIQKLYDDFIEKYSNKNDISKHDRGDN